MAHQLKLLKDDFFASDQQAVAVADRYPQDVFAEHTHDFCELVMLLNRHRYTSDSLPPTSSETLLDKLITRLAASLKSPFALDKFCDEASCSERVLRQQFRQQTGMTINQYLRQVRVCHAQYLLQHSRLLISDISTECGFEDSNYFSVVFTRETGMTPSQWRHLNSQKD
ncbi:helix-turn-helix domain-containing protein [Escherichia coli]|uniref:helix-turn-helix domain-containing protein n=1 Tax=Escherichia coli TaxID=562 RepID=UPI000DD5837B|nr:helix-turn-helix domain-containing protein [Escherichia coli]